MLAISFARIHRANLVNFGILPLTFADPADRDGLALGERVDIGGVREAVASGMTELRLRRSGGDDIVLRIDLSERERSIVLEGGLLNAVRERSGVPA